MKFVGCLVAVIEIIDELSCSTVEISEKTICISQSWNGRNYQQRCYDDQHYCGPSEFSTAVVRTAASTTLDGTVSLTNAAAKEKRPREQKQN